MERTLTDGNIPSHLQNRNHTYTRSQMPLRIVILGSGNVATHIAEAFGPERVVQIWSRHPDNALSLADRIGTTAVSRIEDHPCIPTTGSAWSMGSHIRINTLRRAFRSR